MASHRDYSKGEGVGFLNFGYGESCEFVYACGSSMHQKCLNYALTNLLFGLCKVYQIMWLKPSQGDWRWVAIE